MIRYSRLASWIHILHDDYEKAIDKLVLQFCGPSLFNRLNFHHQRIENQIWRFAKITVFFLILKCGWRILKRGENGFLHSRFFVYEYNF